MPYTPIYRTTRETRRKLAERAVADPSPSAVDIMKQTQRPTTSRTVSSNDTTAHSLSKTVSNNSMPGLGSYGGNRRTSLSSFPSSRSPSIMSKHSRPSRSPNPPVIDRSSDPSSSSNSNSKAPSSGVSSQHSSLSAPRRYNPDAHPKRKLRSQYPRGSVENHVEYILVASFDIDKGPIMEHQYPVAITGDENMLAELMLPDQAHVRNQDWTIFFLHKDTSQEEEEAELREERRRRRQRRKDRAAGLLSEDDIESGDDEDVEDGSSGSESESDDEGGEGPPLIYVLNLVNTKQDKTAKRGAVVKAMAICTRHPFLHIYKVGWRTSKCAS